MAERPEDLNLPNAVVTRIIKDALPSGVNVGKEARLAISKAASVFVLYATSCANNNAVKGKRKTINSQDVLTAVEDMEFDSFIAPLKTALEAHKKSQNSKKIKKAKASKPKEAVETVTDDAGDNITPSREAETENENGDCERTTGGDVGGSEATEGEGDGQMDTSS